MTALEAAWERWANSGMVADRARHAVDAKSERCRSACMEGSVCV